MKKISKIIESLEKGSVHSEIEKPVSADVVWFEDAVKDYLEETAWTKTREIPIDIKNIDEFFDRAYSLGLWIQFSRQGGTVSLIGKKTQIRSGLQTLLGLTQDDYIAQVRSETPFITKAELNKLQKV